MPELKTVCPKSFDEVQDAFQSWLAEAPKELRSSFRFKRLLGDAGPGLVGSVHGRTRRSKCERRPNCSC